MTKRSRVPFFIVDGVWGYHLPNATFIPDSIHPVLPEINSANGVFRGVDEDLPQLRALTCLVDVDDEDWDDDGGLIPEASFRDKYTPNIAEKYIGIHNHERGRRNA